MSATALARPTPPLPAAPWSRELLPAALAEAYAGLPAPEIIADLLSRAGRGRTALVSSFGTESAVLLHMVAAVDPATPVLFLDTGKLFGETLRYKDQLVRRLGLTDIRVIRPQPAILAAEDGDGLLFSRDADRCCAIRKVMPLAAALAPFTAWINGRKGHHGGTRAAMPEVEADGPRIKVTPLARWDAQAVRDYFTAHDLPPHPLEEDGFPSVGCYTCTTRVLNSADPRAGRWAGLDKTECGIHTAELIDGAGI